MSKAISIKQPWASLIVAGIKDIENRTWATKYRGPLLIHAGAFDPGEIYQYLNHQQVAAMSKIWGLIPKLHRSAIIGQVDIVDCVINHPSVWAERTEGYEEHIKDFWGNKNWRKESQSKPIYNWVLANPVQFDEPILNVKGKLSLWEWEGKS